MHILLVVIEKNRESGRRLSDFLKWSSTLHPPLPPRHSVQCLHLYSVKARERLWFSDVFRRYEMGILTRKMS